LSTETHIPKHTPPDHLKSFYKTFFEIKHQKYDGMIVTGAPLEHVEFVLKVL
jgi:homoserine O-succinyltransferase